MPGYEDELHKHREAESQLDRELDESRGRARVAPPPHARHRTTYSIPLVVVVSAIAAVVGYLLVSLVVKFGGSPLFAYLLPGLAITALVWGITGINRTRASAGDRLVDIAVCAIVGPLLLVVVQRIAGPMPALWDLFDHLGAASAAEVVAARARGLDGVPPFHEVVTWAAVASCAAIAGVSIVRIVVEHKRVRPEVP